LNRGTDMELLYDIFDRYMSRKDKLYLFYMVVAMIKFNEQVINFGKFLISQEIMQIHKGGDDVKFIMYLNREIKDKTLNSKSRVEIIFAMYFFASILMNLELIKSKA
jgi:hypothetical protein